MATPACIGVKSPDKIVCIYLSSSGYPQWAGAVLLRHWNTQEKVEQLLQQGNLYHIDAELGESHDRFASQNTVAQRGKPINEHWCQFKLRDHDRRFPPPADEHAQTFQNLETLLTLNSAQDTPWTYLFQDGKWFVYDAQGRDIELTEEYLSPLTSTN